MMEEQEKTGRIRETIICINRRKKEEEIKEMEEKEEVTREGGGWAGYSPVRK